MATRPSQFPGLLVTNDAYSVVDLFPVDLGFSQHTAGFVLWAKKLERKTKYISNRKLEQINTRTHEIGLILYVLVSVC